jgi:tetratricopeptide (TPR) repeat protein
MFAQGFNTYDSLGDAYRENGDKQLAIQNYKKSLELNPKNTAAIENLKKLEASTVPRELERMIEILIGQRRSSWESGFVSVNADSVELQSVVDRLRRVYTWTPIISALRYA